MTPRKGVGLDDATLVRMYRTMRTIRAFEEATFQMYTQALMPGLAHLYIGQEAVAAGVCEALAEEDYIASTHRGHGHLVARGCELRRMMAEILGRRTGYCKGKGGSMHISNIEKGIIGANGIVGGGIPSAVGAALACKMQDNGRVVACFFGDAASNNGTFHESLNMAGLWKCPVVFVCENNLYGISVSQERHQAIKDIADRAAGYGMPGYAIDGNDVVKVFEASVAAVESAREGKGPTLLEMKTYRWGGHHVADPDYLYRPKEEVEEWKKKCPIARLEKALLKEKVLDKAKADAIDKEIEKEVAEAVEFAKASPFPAPEEAIEDLFVCSEEGECRP